MNPTSEPSANPSNFGENLLRFKKDQKFLLYDTETCNLNLVSRKNVPWEYAWMLCTQKEILEEQEYLVQWDDIPISDDAARITGFYQKQHKIALEGKSPQFVLDRFESLLYDESIIPVAHNGLGFDVYVHNIHRKNCGKRSDYSYIRRALDTNLLARAKKLQIPFPKQFDKAAAFQYKVYGNPVRGVKTSIRVLCPEYGIEYDETKAHAALYDVRLLRQILNRLLYEVEI
jgi:DNA polymerase III epsilon subunit-like protein